MKKIIKMILYRIWHKKAYLFLPIIVTPIVLILAINFTQNISANVNIAVVGKNENKILENGSIKVTYVQQKPAFSKVMDGTYDAIVTTNNGTYNIETDKDNHVKEAINNFLQGKPSILTQSSSYRGEISNLTGFIMMFILLIGVMLYKFYYEERGTIENRILSMPISPLSYIMSHCITVWGMVFFPTFIIISIYKLFIGFDSTVNIAGIASIVFLMSFLGSSFGLLLTSLIRSEENAILVGAMSVIITTLLSGSFREITTNGITPFIQKLLPQKYILDYAICLENNQTINITGIIYILLLCGVFILIAVCLKYKKVTPFIIKTVKKL